MLKFQSVPLLTMSLSICDSCNYGNNVGAMSRVCACHGVCEPMSLTAAVGLSNESKCPLSARDSTTVPVAQTLTADARPLETETFP